ncbi:hypothetical protein D8I35_17825 [Corticibacter populi]|uniref:PilY1 beta-propeller domain-containing protein n=1 Tax=Corticibacter populi TaxID=1550736 RepID=A0A3M6QJZ1_9BURK|nr:PilC/PilY family type IV pilus protein [Corticibacter populi]RMX03031.1 hypothetical protein D8I35_17825 [Corticibacter populi]RZS33464.1 type IV pilus assembly protein PilY1 [Corticibacter populi]
MHFLPCLARAAIPGRQLAIRALVPLLSALVWLPAQAAETDIADEPLISMTEVKAKPNLMFILDDSTSMNRAYMPDNMSGSSYYGYYSAQCNGVAYDPAYTYTAPLYADGTSYPDASFTAAWSDGYTQSSTVNLQGTGSSYTASSLSSSSGSSATLTFNSGVSTSTFTAGSTVTVRRGNGTSYSGTVTSWTRSGNTYTLVVSLSGFSSSGTGNWTVTTQGSGQTYYTYTGSQTAMDWTYGSSGSVNTSTTFYKECMTSASSSSSVFTKVTVTSSSSEATNYANWYSYYRTRLQLMRTAVGQAFTELDDSYRVGFMTLGRTGITNGTTFRDIQDFDTAWKSNFYSSLYGTTTYGTTPSRVALSRAGRYFAKKISGQSYDPMEYACQRNFALLTTDGYWNGDYGVKLDGSTYVGDMDSGSDVGLPLRDATKTANTLADVAFYYYQNDLRSDLDDVVPTSGRDTATHQHMTTYTVGLGVNGTLSYDADYLNQTSGDYVDLSNGTKSWPVPYGYNLGSSNGGGNATNIDDLWHAAVNGRGQYYSAMNASALTDAIQGVVSAVQQSTGSASGASTSTLDLVAGSDNVAYEASYTTLVWSGDVVAWPIDGTTAEVDGDAIWSAATQLASTSYSSRTIWFNQGGNLTSFTWANLQGSHASSFASLCSSLKLSQCSSLSSSNKTLLNNGEHVVNFLRGQRSYEVASNSTSPLFRTRDSLLGDIINSKPIYVGAPPFSYTDSGYTAFKTAQASRTPMVYAGANDGMLHAFNANTGKEQWAYVPTAVIPNLYYLADKNYGTNSSYPHRYYVDGKTVQADVYWDGEWRTMLVGGLNAGGQSYYALDITSPESPKLLWEFTDSNLGLSYGVPIVTKLADGTWVVAFSSGYNNTSGDGKGHLYVVSARSGEILRNIATTAGSPDTPSGLAQLNAWVSSSADNTVLRFYGGDMLGNVWRFDVDDLVQPYQSALLLAQMQDASGNGQPITTEPKLREISSQPVVVVTTGRYLGTSDIADDQVQSIAAIRDPLTATGWGVVRTSGDFVEQNITINGTAASNASVGTVSWSSGAGWWLDFPQAGERVFVAAEWAGSRLIVSTAIPSGDVCSSGGASWLYYFTISSGAVTAEQFSADSLIVGLTVVTASDGSIKVLVRDSSGGSTVEDAGQSDATAAIQRARRISWRELID